MSPPLSQQSVSMPVVEPSQIGDARRAVANVAQTLGFDATEIGRISIVVTELATNLARHATGGELVVRSLDVEGISGIELLAIDRGPGMNNVGQSMRDGFSTGGTAGNGLGAVRRMSAEFDLCSLTDPAPPGTVLVSRLWAGSPPVRRSGVQLGAVCVPLLGEESCGDNWCLQREASGVLTLIVADGLGHGLLAADASRLAVKVFRGQPGTDLPRLMELLHAALRPTRGAAVAVARWLPGGPDLRFLGVGNIAATIVTGEQTRSLLSHNGTVGAELRRVQEFTYPWASGALLVMHSDGLSSQWRLDKYRGLRTKHAAVIAGTLYRDHRRARDDATVVVARDEANPQAAAPDAPTPEAQTPEAIPPEASDA